MNEQERRAFRAFVRANHPDRGGDHDEFVAGLGRFATTPRTGPDHAADRATPSGDRSASDRHAGDERYDRPVEVVGPMPFPVRVGVALIRTWHRHRRRRVR